MGLEFNGTSSKVESSADILTTTYPRTYFCWIRPDSTTPDRFVLSDGTAAEMLGIYGDGSGKINSWQVYAGTGYVIGTSAITADWQPVMVVFTSATSHTVYYKNGSAVTGNPFIGGRSNSSSNRLVVGQYLVTGTYWWDGGIAELGVWSSALTQGNFDSLAAGAAPETIATGSIVDVWSFETSAATQTGLVNSIVLTASNTSTTATHPITRSSGSSVGAARNYYSQLLGVASV